MQLVEHKGADMEARFYIDGVRVSREKAEHLKQQAYMFGRLDCFMTKGREISGGRTRRTNYSTLTIGA